MRELTFPSLSSDREYEDTEKVLQIIQEEKENQ